MAKMVTAPTVLGQLFQVIEGCYHGDSLQCLTDFLIPARHLLETVHQGVCASYSDVVFRCAGWPLCLHDHIVVHLAQNHPLLLSPGDFYLQVVPFDHQAARFVVQSLLGEERHELEETPVAEAAYLCIFTHDWLTELNVGRHGEPLRRCLLATDQGVVKVSWDQVIRPGFADEPRCMASSGSADQQDSRSGRYLQGEPVPPVYSVETRICPAKDGIAVSLCLVDSSSKKMDSAGPGTPVGWVSANIWDSRSKSCFRGQNPDRVDGTRDQPRPPALKPHGLAASDSSGPASHVHRTCGRTVRFAEQPCTPCMRRKHGQGTQSQECRYKEFYMEAQQSPVVMEKSPQEPVPSGKCTRTNSKTLRRPDLECSEQRSHAETVANSCTEGDRNVSESFSNASEGLMHLREGSITCLVPNVVGTSEKCHVVIQGQPSEGSRDSYIEMLPRLHVVPGKKTTTFGLVSPKLNRRRTKPKHGCFSEDDPQDPKTLSPLTDGSWRDVPKSTIVHAADVEKARPTGLPPAASKPETCLLQSGVACLTGGRDRSGRAVVEVYGDHTNWGSPLVSSLELSTLLLYYNTITRKVREAGLTVVYDARYTPLHLKFTEALQMVQEQDPRAVHCVLVLQSKEKVYSHEKDLGQMGVVTSIKALHKCVESSQLTPALDGSFIYRHRGWLKLHQELHPFVLDLKEVTNLLLESIRKLEGVHKIDTVQDVEQCISEQRALMKDVLEDSRLVALQREGGAVLARLRWEFDVRVAHCEEICQVIDTVEALCNQVEEQVHVLTRRSNVSLQHLTLLLQLREMESRFTKIKEWFDVEADRQLLEAESVEVSRERIQETLQSFSTFYAEAHEQKHKAMMLLTEAEHIQGPNYPETEVFHTMVSIFKSSLSDFLSRAEQCCDTLRDMVNLCHFCRRATEVADACSQQLEQNGLQCITQEEKWTNLQQCHQKLSEFSPERFHDAEVLAGSLQSSRGMQVWNMAWLRCQDVSRQLEESLQDLEQAQQRSVLLTCKWRGDGGEVGTAEAAAGGTPVASRPDTQRSPPEWREIKQDRGRESVYGTVTCFNFRHSRKGRKGSRTVAATDQGLADCGKNMPKKTSDDYRQKVIEGSATTGCQWFPWKNTSSRYRGENSGSASNSFKTTPSIYTTSNSPTPLCSDVQVLEAAYSGTQNTSLTCSGTHTSIPTSVNSYSGTHTSLPTLVTTCSGTHTSLPTSVTSCSGTHTSLPTLVTACSGTHTSVPTCSKTKTSVTTSFGNKTPVLISSEAQDPLPDKCQIQPCERPRQTAQYYQHPQPGRLYSEESNCGEELLGSTSHSKDTLSRAMEGGKVLNVHGTTTNTMKLFCILEELLVTELEYTRSLGYVLTHYLPLLARPDVPPDLRGQRGRIFSNLEKLYDFHCHYFLQELESCRTEPLRVGRCFLRHKESFGLYALYSKNKPQSDVLIQQHKYFKCKQLELGDCMDLSSYLLKPVQRISKYSLLLQEMLEECGPDHGLERQEIQAAAEVVRLQLRHGNDLLTMDAIQDCDVSLKEQGRLIRQDEFYVTFRKKRALHRVFLFHELILFTKPKKTLRGDDVYVYKQSFKTCDIGLTRSYGDGDLCFEIWFRRRRLQHTYMLQAETQDVKQAWTADLEQILWKQALKNRELWRQERVFMGVGSKSFMDLQTSEAAIHDKSISCLLPGRESEGLLKTSNLVVSSFQSDLALPRPESNGSGSCVSTSGSRSSSSSGRGSLSPRGFHENQVHGNIHGMFLPHETLSGDDYQNQCRRTDNFLGESACSCGGSDCATGGCPAVLTATYTTLSPAAATQCTPACVPQLSPPSPARNKLTRGCELLNMAHISLKDREQICKELY